MVYHDDVSFDHNNLFGLEMPADFLSIAFTAVVSIGGVIGYVKSGIFKYQKY